MAAIMGAFVMFAWLYLPSPRQRSSRTITLEPLAQEGGEAFPGGWILKVDSPRSIHLGGSGTLRLTVSPEPALPRPSGWVSNYNVIVGARAKSAAGAPPACRARRLAPGRAARFE
jgi:hypothetical protein